MIRYARRFLDPQNLYRRWIDHRVHSLRLADVIAYLRSREWTEVPPDRAGYRVFREPPSPGGETSPYYQFVPDSEADDLPLRMFELITGLAETEDRPCSEVIDDILRQAGRDQPNGAASSSPAATEPVRT
jgi:hypothetical protein